MLVPCDVGGATTHNSVKAMIGRFQDALALLAAWIATGYWHKRRRPRGAPCLVIC
jgi:hypothetical protein